MNASHARDYASCTKAETIELFRQGVGVAAATLALGTHSEVRGRNADPARHMVALETDDVDAEWKRLSAAGVEFIENPTDSGQLRIATMKDPEGNLIQLLQPIRG